MRKWLKGGLSSRFAAAPHVLEGAPVPRSRCFRSSGLSLIGVLALLLTSCGDGGPKLYPVSGKVLFNDQPAEGATVVFHPSDSTMPKPSATVGADGSFALRTHPHGEGAPAGDYSVIVTWYPPNSRGLDRPQNKLPGRYADPAQSGLKATVQTGPTELQPFQLTK
jgi:hypothetical protein